MSMSERPTPGRVVHYQTDGRNYDYFVPALVVITVDNLVKEAVEAGVMFDLTDEWHVHLWTPGGKEPYREFNVPYSSAGERRSWRWPVRV